MANPEFSAEFVRATFSYHPDTGHLFWLKKAAGIRRTAPAGSRVANGYREVIINKTAVASHRLIWLHVHGVWPAGVIDHINGDRSDNRLANLRDVSQQTNLQNLQRPKKNNQLGFLGVTYVPRRRKSYKARLCINGKGTIIGMFDTPEEAHEAYLLAKRIHHSGCCI